MYETQRSLLMEAYNIVASFRDMVAGDITEKTRTLYMSQDYQDLHTACALMGEALCGDGMPVRAIQSEATRETLRRAYQAADMLMRNAAPETEWQDCCATLLACLFTPLNTACLPEEMQDTLASLIEAARIGLDLMDGLDAAGPTEDAGWYLDPNGETYEKRQAQIRSALELLVPKAYEEKPSEGSKEHEADR